MRYEIIELIYREDKAAEKLKLKQLEIDINKFNLETRSYKNFKIIAESSESL